MLKAGQYIGMGTKTVDLLVEVQTVHGSKMKGYVVNGNWEFDYSMSTGKMDFNTPCGHETLYSNVLFTNEYPEGLGDYNGIIQYMNNYITSSRVSQFKFKISAFVVAMVLFVKEAPTRANNAFWGLVAGWNAPLARRYHDDCLGDEDIPF